MRPDSAMNSFNHVIAVNWITESSTREDGKRLHPNHVYTYFNNVNNPKVVALLIKAMTEKMYFCIKYEGSKIHNYVTFASGNSNVFRPTHTNTHKLQHCCVLLANNVESVCMGLSKSLTGLKLYATSANIVVVPCKRTQHVGPNNVACCYPTMLRPFT